MATLIIPAPLRKFTDNCSKVSIDGVTIYEILNGLTYRYPAVKKHLFDTENKVRPFINIFIGNEHIQNAQQPYISETSVISIIPAIAGG